MLFRRHYTRMSSHTVEIVYNEHQDQAEFARYNQYRYNHIRASKRPDFSTKSTRYIRLLVMTGLVIYDFYCTSITRGNYAE